MVFGNRTQRPPASKRSRAFRPAGQALEARVALAIDLIGANLNQPNVADNPTTAAFDPLGVLLAGNQNGGGAGFSSAELGDVNGDGFDDFLVGAPGIDVPSPSGGLFDLSPNFGASQAFLVFGSRQVGSAQAVNFATLTAQQRVGDLAAVGNTIQPNPLNGATGFAFDGLRFTTGQNPTSGLGTSVAAVGDINGDNFNDFMIGAPLANDSAGIDNDAGRAYFIYGGPNLVRANKTVDLDNPTANTDLNIVTFVTSQPDIRLGRAVAGIGDVLTNGVGDIAIGAPRASVAGVGLSGGVFVISGNFFRPIINGVFDVALVGQAGTLNNPGIPGVLFGGENPGDEAGAALAGAGDFNNERTAANQATDDLLIGAPQTTTGSGQAYVVYGAINLVGQAVVVNGVASISLSRIAAGVDGAVFTGAASGDVTGFAVASAGDFNNDTIADILIGSPGFQTNTGRAHLIFGRPATPATPGEINGRFALSGLPAEIPNVEFRGQAAGSLAGFSATAVGRINNDTINEIAIGAPGVANGAGAVYLIPGNADLVGQVILSVAGIEIPAIAGQVITASQPVTPRLLGTSVSGRLGTNRSGQTIDADGIGDLIIGAAGFELNTARNDAGAVFALEGRFLPLAVPVSTAITSDIGTDEDGDGLVNPPFVINALTPDDLQIFILSRNRNDPNFVPFRDIDPATIRVNGIPLPDPSTFQSETSLDGDGVDDASFIFSPRSLLGLTSATTTLTVTARTRATSPLPNRRYTGTTPIQVTGGGGTPGGGALPAAAPSAGFFGFRGFVPPFGEVLVPRYPVLTRLQHKPIPVRVALRQFLPRPAFGQRFRQFYHPQDTHPLGSRHDDSQGRTSTLGRDVFTRGRFRAGQFVGPIHHRRPRFSTVPPVLP